MSEPAFQQKTMPSKRRWRDSRGMQHTDLPIRVFLADDSALSRRRVAEMLTAQDMVIAGQVSALIRERERG